MLAVTNGRQALRLVLMEKNEQRDSMFYDLLPLGTMIDTDSIVATTYTNR